MVEFRAALTARFTVSAASICTAICRCSIQIQSLKQILENQRHRSVEEYYWQGATYLRVFMAGQKDGARDGLRTVEALTLINKGPDATWKRT